jgi:hypothetical protein
MLRRPSGISAVSRIRSISRRRRRWASRSSRTIRTHVYDVLTPAATLRTAILRFENAFVNRSCTYLNGGEWAPSFDKRLAGNRIVFL